MAPKAVLVGLPGSGKSTIGRRLAKATGLTMLDTDAAIERTTGRSIAAIFSEDGEQEFRRIEEEVVREALRTHDGVLSLGGGAVTTPGVRDALAGHTVIYLEISAAEGVRRTGGNTVRPLLAGPDRAERYRELMAARVPLYRRVATMRINTNRRNPGAVVRHIVSRLEAAPAPAPAPAPVDSAPAPKPKSYAVHELTVRFGTGDDMSRRSLKRLQPLPSAAQPVLIYMGVLKDGKTAVFLVDHGVEPVGDGECMPRPDDCETIRLRTGETEFLDVKDDTGAVTEQYQLDLLKIHQGTTASAAKAKASSRSGARIVRARAAQDGPAAYRFDAARGTLERRAHALRSSVARSSSGLG